MMQFLTVVFCLVCGVVQADSSGAPEGADVLMVRPDTVALSPFVAYGQLDGGERRYIFPSFGLVLTRNQHQYPHLTEWRTRGEELGLTSVSNLTALRGFWFARPARPLRIGDAMVGRFVYDPVSHDPAFRWEAEATFERVVCPAWLRDAAQAEQALRVRTGGPTARLSLPSWFVSEGRR